ncbi:hypothetical protein BC940DRAFT_292261 [Gongronella butleri]|nr:hypothetical protein BC940DRAFT_292261 [Gongronella butleri]
MPLSPFLNSIFIIGFNTFVYLGRVGNGKIEVIGGECDFWMIVISKFFIFLFFYFFSLVYYANPYH